MTSPEGLTEPTATRPPGPSESSLFIVERILRDRDGVWRQIIEQRDLPLLLRQMLLSSVVSLACYGAVLGSSKGWLQALSSTVKLPVLFLATLAICLPTLYLFNLVFGARLMMTQAVSLIMVCVTVTSVLTLAFAPISLFFRITAQSYAFFKLLNVTILVLTAVVGLRFLITGMRALNRCNEHQPPAGLSPSAQPPVIVGQQVGGTTQQALVQQAMVGNGQPGVESTDGAGSAPDAAQAHPQPTVTLVADPAGNGAGLPVFPGPRPVPGRPQHPGQRPFPPRPHQGVSAGHPGQFDRPQTNMALLYVWILLFGFVGTQLAWTLRPFFGSPGEPFEIFRNIQGTFYGDILRTIGHLLGG